MKKILFSIIGTFVILSSVFADEISFVTSAPNAVEVNQQFRLSYKVNRGNVKEPKIDSITDFDILSGPNRSSSSSMSIVNGQMTSEQSVTFTYILLATKEGTFTIPGATIKVDGEEITSNSVTIKVLPSDSNISQGGQQSSNSSSMRNVGNSSSTNIDNNDLFMTATLNKTKVYEQEAVLLTYKVYSRVNLAGLNGKVPDLKGFQIQEIDLPQNKEWQLEHYKGSNYRTIVWRQFVLFPQQTGEIEIPSVTYEGIVQQRVNTSMDPFDFFMNGGPRVVEVKKALVTPKLKLNVEKLPAGKPSDFSGGVGRFKLSSSINHPDELKTNDAITLRLKISGTGNMKLIKTPEVVFPEDFEIYDPKVENNFSLKTNGFSGEKVIDYLAIPRHAGEYEIPSIKFSYFDLDTKEYKTIETDSYKMNVAKGKESSNEAVASFVSKEELKMLGQDVRYLKQGDVTLSKKGDYLFASTRYYLWYIVPLLLFGAYLALHYKKMSENANIAKTKTKKANKAAIKRLKVAQRLLKENKKNEFYDEILKALWGYIGDKLNIPVSRLTKDNVADELLAKGVGEELIKELENVLNESEFARYAPGDANAAMDNVYTMAMNVISKMENTIKR